MLFCEYLPKVILKELDLAKFTYLIQGKSLFTPSTAHPNMHCIIFDILKLAAHFPQVQPPHMLPYILQKKTPIYHNIAIAHFYSASSNLSTNNTLAIASCSWVYIFLNQGAEYEKCKDVKF